MGIGICKKKVFKDYYFSFLCCFEAQLKETLQCKVHEGKVVKLSKNFVFEIMTLMTFIIQFSAPLAKLLALFFDKSISCNKLVTTWAMSLEFWCIESSLPILAKRKNKLNILKI